MTHGQCDARPTVTFPVAERRRPLAGTNLYCLVTEAHGCEQLAQSCYSVADRPGVELVTFRSRANALPIEPPSLSVVKLILQLALEPPAALELAGRRVIGYP